jgi:hypothetical protein
VRLLGAHYRSLLTSPSLSGSGSVVGVDRVLDRIDGIVTPATNINPADGGWVGPALVRAARRR